MTRIEVCGLSAPETVLATAKKPGRSRNPLRTHPGQPKTSFGEMLLIGRNVVQRRQPPCFADTDADGQMDSAMIGEDRGYLLPTIDKQGKPTLIAPFAVRETDPAKVISFPLRLTAGLMTIKKEPPCLTFSLSVSLGDYASDLVGFRLIGKPRDRVLAHGRQAESVKAQSKNMDASITSVPNERRRFVLISRV